MNQLFPSCAEAARRVSEQHDAKLGRTARAGLKLHLILCRHCRRFSRQVEFLQSCMRGYPEQLSDARLPDHVRAKIVHRLSELR